ncbi:hypothetical protein NDU88_005439 [Pleurodeles waltl]|uniref:Uncharacterized protein n=1 Tax=Pleurodeles waltl TaxID=8319 RepID=A0AAV7LS52_PLEWA|nr:hypothetical protein NDU88_005439 [Pleurodeles waltl]
MGDQEPQARWSLAIFTRTIKGMRRQPEYHIFRPLVERLARAGVRQTTASADTASRATAHPQKERDWCSEMQREGEEGSRGSVERSQRNA